MIFCKFFDSLQSRFVGAYHSFFFLPIRAMATFPRLVFLSMRMLWSVFSNFFSSYTPVASFLFFRKLFKRVSQVSNRFPLKSVLLGFPTSFADTLSVNICLGWSFFEFFLYLVIHPFGDSCFFKASTLFNPVYVHGREFVFFKIKSMYGLELYDSVIFFVSFWTIQGVYPTHGFLRVLVDRFSYYLSF